MDQKPSPKQVLLTVIFFTCLFFLAILNVQKHSFEKNGYSKIVSKDIQTTNRQNKTFPLTLKIPKIDVDANIEHVGLNKAGEMDVPSRDMDVAWFAYGPSPGEKGSAVIAGHMNGEGDSPGVFINLHKLKPGDLIYVHDSSEKLITFVVRESRIYNPGTSSEVFNLKEKSHLNLVTCNGVWDENKKSFSKRLVVFADILE